MLVAIVVAVVLVAELVARGFRDGDLASDVLVRAHTSSPGGPQCRGGWVQVTIANPSPSTALAALTLRRSGRLSRLSPAIGRRTMDRRIRLSLRDQLLGAVRPETAETFWLWADDDPRRVTVEVAVGTPGRLRLHRLPGARLEPAAAPADVVLRSARPDDADAIARLAELDEAPVPPAPLLLAHASGELWAAVSLDTLEHISDPFRPSAGLAALARQRARQLHAGHRAAAGLAPDAAWRAEAGSARLAALAPLAALAGLVRRIAAPYRILKRTIHRTRPQPRPGAPHA
jgi:hypothetical protein